MHGFRDYEVLLQGGYDVIVISPLGGAPGDFSWRILKELHDFLIAFYSNFLSGMHGFRDNEVLLQTRYDVIPLQGGYDVIVISPLGSAPEIFHDGFWENDHDCLIAFHNKFLFVMHCFRDNEVLLQGGYDVIVISPLGGVSRRFCWRNLKERPQFHNHGSLTHFAYLLPFGVNRHFILAVNMPFATNFRRCF